MHLSLPLFHYAMRTHPHAPLFSCCRCNPQVALAVCKHQIRKVYRYTRDLQTLAAGSSLVEDYTKWPRYTSPINLVQLEPFLRAHPDQGYASYMHKSIHEGFRIGFHGPRDHLRSNSRNHPSALSNPHVVQERLHTELAANRILGPITSSSNQPHSSPLGLVPKAHQANKWRLICDLSAPHGHSVNDGIPTALCSLQYATVHDAVNIINALGRDTQLIKLDLKDA